ncbi:MAG: hypothetical protein JXA77_06460 [Bacteroidales bacterium]|nr:hypothetical protein [Bacteroidales bacterium]MBN2819478.1 hypothetical protein [Bacteroidales bacterium]
MMQELVPYFKMSEISGLKEEFNTRNRINIPPVLLNRTFATKKPVKTPKINLKHNKFESF